MMHANDCIDLRVIRGLCQRLGVAEPFQYKDGVVLPSDPGIAAIDPYQFGVAYGIQRCLSKWAGWKQPDVTPSCAALTSWQDAEDQCARTNAFLRKPVYERNARVEAVIFMAQRKIAAILGEAPSLIDIDRNAGWSNGATFSTKRGVGIGTKTASHLTVTHEAKKWANCVIGRDPCWMQAVFGERPDGPVSLLNCTEVQEVAGNRFSTVPKNAKTDRPISIEPSLNIFLQKGVGRILRSRLKRWGIDLDDQSKNQRLASSLDVATIDLSSASDTICSVLVRELLPLDWWLLLDDLRSKNTKMPDGQWVKLNKFSSMGNGFTFELESAIFYAICLAVCEIDEWPTDRVSVFGDDMIVPVGAAPAVMEALEVLGFTVNREKSFWNGPFRESCGKHYFLGIEVTPFYLREKSDTVEAIIRNHNRIYRWVLRILGYKPNWLFRLLAPYRKAIAGLLSQKLKGRPYAIPQIPDNLEDDRGLLTPREALHVHYDHNHGFECHVWVPRAKFQPDSRLGGLAVALRSFGEIDRRLSPWFNRGTLKFWVTRMNDVLRSGKSPHPKGWWRTSTSQSYHLSKSFILT